MEKENKSEQFTQRVEAWLTAHDLTQGQGAKLLGVGRTYLNQVKGGKKEPGPRLQARLAYLEDLSDAGLRALLEEEEVDRSEHAGGTPLDKVRAGMRRAGVANAAELAKRMGYQIGPVQAVVERGVRASEGMLADMAKALGLDKAELMDGGSVPVMQEDRPGFGVVGQRPSLSLPKGMNARVIPLLSFATAGQYAVSPLEEDWCADDGFVAFNVADRSAFALRIEGDSMAPKIVEGDVVVVSPQKTLRLGQTVVVRTTRGEVLCKIWGGTRNGGVALNSVNPTHPPLIFPEDQIAWIYPVAQHTHTH